MNRKLLMLACLSVAFVAACKQEAPVEPAAMPEPAPAATPAPAPVATESAPAASKADVPFDTKGFAGTFQGTMPCADCPGTDTVIALAADGTFKLEQTNQGKDGKSTFEGTWTVEADNTHVRLDPNSKSEDDRVFEIVSKDELRTLDKDGNAITTTQPHSLARQPAAK